MDQFQQANSHRRVHDASPVRPDGVGNVTDVDGVEVLVVRPTFHKYLSHNQEFSYIIIYIFSPFKLLGE